MDVPTNIAVPLLGLIWSTYQIAMRALSDDEQSKKHKATGTFFGYIVTWAVLAELIFVAPLPSPLNIELVVAVSVLFSLVMIWAYQAERISKIKVPLRLRGVRILSYVSFVTACVTEVLSLDILYQTGYLMGAYDSILLIGMELGLTAGQVNQRLTAVLPDLLPTVQKGVPSSLVGIAISTVLIALLAYRQGVIRGRKQIK